MMNPAPMVIPRISRSLAPLAAIDELLAAGCFADARALVDTTLRAVSADAGSSLRAHCVLRRAFCELAVSHNENALISAREAADIFCDLEDLSFESAALACCSVAAARLGLSFEAIESALRARRISDQSGDIPGEVQACLALGHAYAWDQDPVRADEAFEQVGRLAEQGGSAGSVAEAMAGKVWARLLQSCHADGGQTSSPAKELLAGLIDSRSVAPDAPTRPRCTPRLWSSPATTFELARGLCACWQGDTAAARTSADRLSGLMETVRDDLWQHVLCAWLAAEIARAEGSPDRASRAYEEMREHAAAAEQEALARFARKLSASHHAATGQTERAFVELSAVLRQEGLLRDREVHRSASTISSLLRKTDELKILAFQDALTGLANHRKLQLCLSKWSAVSRDSGEPLCAAVIDVDHFKQINDHYLHETGDRVLEIIARIMREHVRSCDLPARYGGDEFVVLFKGASLPAAREISDRIERAVADYEWSTLKPGLAVSISMGVVKALRDDTAKLLIERSDTDMYVRKRDKEQVRTVSGVLVERVARLVGGAKRLVVFVGSGAVSTRSAIASRESVANWRAGDRRRFGSMEGLREDPEAFRAFWAERRKEAESSEPGEIHRVIVSLTKKKPDLVLVTENTEGLLAKAGAQKVHEIYGNVLKDRCVDCDMSFSASDTICPRCRNVQAVRRPAVTLLGEDPDYGALAGAEFSAKWADVLLVIDSDANILPGASLLDKARRRGAKVIMLGVGPHTCRSAADLCVRGDARAFLEKVLAWESATASAASDALSEAGYATLNFLAGHREDHLGRSLQQVLNRTDEQIEREADASPWFFPLFRRSCACPEAPVPSRADFAALSRDDAARDGIRRAFDRMLRFYGFKWKNDKVVKLDQGWERCFDRWASRPSGHDRRISRLIESVRLFAMQREASALVEMLESELQHYRTDDTTTPIRDWQRAAGQVYEVDGARV